MHRTSIYIQTECTLCKFPISPIHFSIKNSSKSPISFAFNFLMGNTAASCAPSLIISSSGAVKVMFLDGRLQVFTKGIKAAELMVENPGQFVCDSSNLKVGNRIHGLTADEELERPRFYFLLPMDLLYSVLTHEEFSSLTYKASRALKHRGSFNNFSKIFPVFSDFCLFHNSEAKRLESDVSLSSSHSTEPVLLEKYSKQRSWKPALDTIVEAPCTH